MRSFIAGPTGAASFPPFPSQKPERDTTLILMADDFERKRSGRPWDKDIIPHEQQWYWESLGPVLEWLNTHVADWAPPPDTEHSDDRTLVINWEERPAEQLQFIAQLGSALHQAFDCFFGKMVIVPTF